MQIMAADWYYIGHYGQLGPLTREQMDELIEGGVIERDTYVWRPGMASWSPAASADEFGAIFTRGAFATPPPTPATRLAPPPAPAAPQRSAFEEPQPPRMPVAPQTPYGAGQTLYPGNFGIKSDKSRTGGGILNIVFPGVGRMYLGYPAIGVIQLVLTICSGGVLWIWPLVDGILMLTGNLKHDGYGRVLTD